MSIETPLIPQHPLYPFIERVFLPAESATERQKSQKAVRITLKAIGIVAAAAARVSMVNICLTAGESLTNESLDSPRALSIGITNSMGTVLGSGLISVVTVNRLVDEITKQLSPEEQRLLAENLPRWQRCAIMIAALSGGFIAQLPMAVGSYFGAVPPIPPDFTAASQMADFSRTAYSIYNTLNELSLGSCNRCRSSDIQALMQFRDGLVKKIDAKKALLDRASPEAGAFVLEIEELIRQNASGAELLAAILSDTPAMPTAQMPLGLDLLSKVFAFSLLAAHFMIALEGIQLLGVRDLALPLVAGILIVMANTYILAFLTKTGMGHVYRLMTCNQNPSLLRERKPKLHTALTIAGTAISALPWAPSIYFAKTYFPQTILQNIDGPTAAVGGFLCNLTASYAFRDMILHQMNRNDRTLQIQDCLSTLSKTVHKTSIRELADFYESLPEDLRESIEPRDLLN